MTATPAFAAHWLRTNDLPFREADAAERARIRDSLVHTQIGYNFDDESVRVLVHDGDLVVDGNFDNGDLLVVRGNLTVEGVYDDYGGGIGVLVVEGDMRAHDVYSWGAMRVVGTLAVRDVLMTVYNDFTFEAGKVDARLLLVSDKSSDFRIGEVEIALTEDSRQSPHTLALRSLLPEAFTGTEHFEFEADASLESLMPDQDWLRRRLHERQPVFRPARATKALTADIRAALAEATDDAQLRELLAKDRLLAQLVAARPGLPSALVEALVELGDERVDQWLGRNAPAQLAQRDPQQLSLEAARALASNPQTPAAMVTALAEHVSPQVRLLVAVRAELPDACLDRLQADPDPEVRERLWRMHAWETAFGWDPGAAQLDARLADEAPGVRDAMVAADLDAEQFARLLPQLSANGLERLALQLHQIRIGQLPSRMVSADIDALALRLLEIPRERFASVHEHVDMRTWAWLALDPVAQGKRMDDEVESNLARIVQQQAPELDLLAVAEHARSRSVLDRLAGLLGPPEMEALARPLAKNPLLPLSLQLRIVERAAAAPAGRGDFAAPTPEVALDELLQNDSVHPEAIEATLALILRRGIRPADGSYQNSFFHLRKLPPAVIAQLDRRLGFSEDWALTLMLQEHATRAQLARALARWYDDDALLQTELAAAAPLDDDGFWLALARARSPKLREAALHPSATAAAVQWLVSHPEPELLGWRPDFHPALPLAARLERIRALPAEQWASDWIELPVAAWEELARSAPERAQRRIAFRRASEARPAE